MMLYFTLVLCLFQWTNGEDVISRRGRKDPPPTPDWLVSLEKNGRLVCGGALIHPDWVLASAGCATSGITTVSLDTCGKGKGGNCKRRMSVANVITHPTWDGGIKDNIAMVQLKGSMRTSKTLKLANRFRDSVFQSFTMAEQECYKYIKGARKTQSVPVGIAKQSACDRVFRSYAVHDPVCSVNKAKSACQRDTDNPTVCKIRKTMFLVGFGVANKKQGNRCFAGLTRASRYLPWIGSTKISADKTNVRTGDRCVPKKVSACADRNAVCTPGLYSYRCLCKAGLELIDGACATIEPAGNQSLGAPCSRSAPKPCSDQFAICENNNNVFTCQCMDGYLDNGQNVCEKPAGNQSLGANCSLLATQPCADENAVCQNNNGVFTCVCKAGYVENGQNVCELDGNQTLGQPCSRTVGNPCADNFADCANSSNGVFTCQCRDGYVDNGESSCVKPGVEQPLGAVCTTRATTPCADVNAVCQNNNDVYTCVCKAGYFENAQNVCELDVAAPE